MSFVNHTPFPALSWDVVDSQRQTFEIVVMRAKFCLQQTAKTNTWTLRPCTEQGDLFEEDLYYDDNYDDQIRFESDYVDFKAKTDVVLNGAAHAPQGKPALAWDCKLQVQSPANEILLEKSLSVHAPRNWTRQRITGFWWLDDKPEPCLSVPLRYRLAYGGELVVNDKEGNETHLVYHAENPIGCGIVHRKHPDKMVPAPQITACGVKLNPSKEYARYQPVGFGFIGKTWEPRLSYVGTYDDDWLENHHPYPPEDFDIRFNQAAPEDMQISPYLQSGAQFTLNHLTYGHDDIKFTLPGYQAWARFILNTGVFTQPLHIDTVVVDVESETPEDWAVYVSWRTSFQYDEEIDSVALFFSPDKEGASHG